MSGSLNKVQLIGKLGKDPEVRSFQNGGKVANLSIATSQGWKDKATGEKKEVTQWHKVTIFADGLVGIAERFLKKGSTVYVEGQLETRKYQDKDGLDRYVTEVVLRPYSSTLTILGNHSGGDDRKEGSQAIEKKQEKHVIDDEIPF